MKSTGAFGLWYLQNSDAKRPEVVTSQRKGTNALIILAKEEEYFPAQKQTTLSQLYTLFYTVLAKKKS